MKSTAVWIIGFVVIAPLLLLVPARSGAATVSGTIRDASGGEPVEAATVFLRDSVGTTIAHATTGAQGEFTLADVPAGRYTLGVTHVGYEPTRMPGVVVGASDTHTVDLALMPSAIRMNPIVVSASRRAERILDTPVPTSVVPRRAIEERATPSPTGHLRDVPAVQITTTGLGRDAVSVRGLGSMMSRDLHALEDYRLIALATPRVAWLELATADDDLDRVEVVRGPAAALYGPNADRGVVHLISKSPFDVPGTAVRLGGGERDVIVGSARHAARIGSTWAYRVSGRYFRGDEWPYEDPVEAARRAAAIAGGADPDTLRIGRRDPISERYSMDASAEWRPRDRTSLTMAGGLGNDARIIGTSDAGALQADNWKNGYGQVRFSRDRLFAQTYANVTESGDSYLLRVGNTLINKSRLYVGQLQNGAALGERTELVYGFDAKRTEPRTEGSIDGRYENDDTVDDLGGYLHAQTSLSERLRAIAALRVDHNSRIADLVFSPRLGLQYRTGGGQQVRLAYNRAYGTPDAGDFFFDTVVDSLPLPMAVRAAGTPSTGFTYRHDANGPMIRSPFTPAVLGGPYAFLTNDVTPFWPVVVAIMQQQGVDLSGIPNPTASDVPTDLFLVDGQTGSVQFVTDMQDVPRLRPTITNSIELGEQGWIGNRVRVEGSVYHTWINNFIGRFRNITPNAFLDVAALQSYLIANGVPPPQAAAYAAAIGRIPLGTVTPEQAFDPADILLVSRNFGTVRFWGADGGAMFRIAEPWSVSGTLSWVSRDYFADLDGVDDVAMNTPQLSGTLSLQFRDPGQQWASTLRLRAGQAYPFQSGIYSGTIAAQTLLDFGVVYRPRGLHGTSFILTADNVLDDRHVEFVGGPEIGRVAVLQIRQEF